METEKVHKMTLSSEYEERKNDATSRYMDDTRKQYLLASNNESLQMLVENQKEELTKVLIQLKSEYDSLTRESSIKKNLSEEYTKKINMIVAATESNMKKQEEKKESLNRIKDAIEIKKQKKDEEIYQKKTLTKQVDKLKKDLFIIQKDIVRCENEAVLLEKKKERAKLDENIIKEKGNQIHSKIEEQNKKNKKEKNENDLQVQYYETVIKQKYLFMQFADERKERQKKIEQEAKNDAQDKQEVDKRRKLNLLKLYNQYLRTRMIEQLEKYEELENNFKQIRDICGTQDLSFIIDFIMLRNKRYNYAVQKVTEKEEKIKDLKKDLKKLNLILVKLKNGILVNEKESDSKTETTIENTGIEEEELELMKKEEEKNQNLMLLGEKYNEINLAYTKLFENIRSMKEFDREHPLNVPEEEKQEEKEEGGEEEQEEPQPEKKVEGLADEEEQIIKDYELFLKKILKAFNILYLCKSKGEFMNLMKEKGISQQKELEETGINKVHKASKKKTRRKSRLSTKIIIDEDSKKNSTLDKNEEDDVSKNEQDHRILTQFIKEQKKEIEEFIHVKKQVVQKPHNQGK